MAARSAPRGHLCRRSCYCVEQVDEIMRTDATCSCWPPIELLALPDAELPLALLLPLPDAPLALPVEPEAPGVPVEPEPDPVAPEPEAPEPLDDADVSEPVTST